MEIFNKRHICFSLLAMRFRSSLIRPTNSRKPLMVWSSLSRHDLVSSVQLLHAMICDGASLIILYLCKKNSTNTTILFRLFNDIVLTKDDHQKIIQLKAYLTSHFHIKNLGLLRYFLRIKVTQSSKSLSLSQWKYYTNLLKETDMLGSKPIITPMDPGVCFNQHLGEALADPR